MKEFTVTYHVTFLRDVSVRAENEEEARKIADLKADNFGSPIGYYGRETEFYCSTEH